MATDKRVYTLRLSETNYTKIKAIAEINKRSIAMQIEYLIESHIYDFERNNGEITIKSKDPQ